MKQQARVERRIDENHVLVRLQRQSACGHDCASCGGCGSAKEMTVTAEDPIGVETGDLVSIESSSSSKIIGLSALLYLVPVVMFFLFYWIGTFFWAEELPQALFSCLGFFLGLLGPTALSRRLKGKIPVTVSRRLE